MSDTPQKSGSDQLDKAGKKQPNLRTLGTDPTTPIKLERAVQPTVSATEPTPPPLAIPVPIARPRAEAPTEIITLPPKPDAAWIGSEQTLVGAIAPALASPSAEEWRGSEQTLVGTAAPSPVVPATDAWAGNEATVVGLATPVKTPPGFDPDENWAGREATMLGVPAGPDVMPRKEGGTSQRSGTDPAKKTGTRPTQPTMDDGWHLKGRPGPLTGKALGDYEIGGVLGEGGMGVVYRARQISLKRRCAVKVLPPNLAQDMSLRGRFEQEARTASLLQSPHVVQVYAAGSEDDIIYFVMEFVEGNDLSNLIHEKAERQEPFTPEEAAGYIIQAARGLAEASKHRIVHRDIKPANLMITTKGVVKIADFGISKVAGEHNLTMTGTTVGTPAYCSPEQGRGDQVDPRADIYSLGVAFYELLVGQKPFDGATPNALIYQHNYAEPKLPRDIRPDISEQYQAVCLKCLMKDPASRYQDASELVTDLERIRDGNMSLTAVFQAKFGTGADDAMIRMGLKRRYGWMPLAAAVLFIVLAGGGGLWWFTEQAAYRAAAGERQKQADDLRTRLAPLDRAEAIPATAVVDIGSWKALNGEDEDWKRWSGKIARVGALRSETEPLFAGQTHLTVQARGVAAAKVEALRDAVGDQDPDVIRWSRRLVDTDRLIAELRTGLRPVFAGTLLTVGARNAAATRLINLEQLAGAKDADVEAWTQQSRKLDEDVARRQASLAKLDGVVTERVVGEIEGDLRAYAELVGDGDNTLDAARLRITAFRERLADLRKNLTAIGQPENMRELTEAQRESVTVLLTDYQPMVDAGDSTSRAWAEALKRTQARIDALAERLVRLDQPQALSQAELDAITREEGPLPAYARLVGASDQRLGVWNARIRLERGQISGDEATLTKFRAADEPTIAQRTAAETALKSLDDRGAIPVDVKLDIARRIEVSKVREANLRQYLTDKLTDPEAVSEERVTLSYDQLEVLAGGNDQLIQAWAPRLKEYKALRAILSPLDDIAPIPDRARDYLASFITVTSVRNSQAVRWGAKLDRIDALRLALAPLDLVGPLPLDALANADELHDRLVGPQDPQAARWRTKAHRVTELRAHCSGLFARDAQSNYVLTNPDAARRTLDELIANIGASEPDVRRFDWRERTLRGPGKPAWATRAERDAYGIWAELAVGNAITRLRWIPAGVFSLGSPEDESGREADEALIPEVTVSRGFWLADSETTQDMWVAVMGNNPSRFNAGDAGDRPVERVSWLDARQFCEALAARVANDHGGKAVTVQLPTEAEWEYACRAGSPLPFHGPDGGFAADSVEAVARIAWCGLKDGTRGVRRRDPNRLGLFDMHGNVWEWCRDKYGTYSEVEVVDPEGRQEDIRVIRGGSWGDAPARLRAANRNAVPASMRTLYLGMRFAIVAEWPEGTAPERPGAGL
jgi:formylglycine-generating enzyme required for sulfatase activity/tRNA A-37 threonylcarbamoyl transferase component Bud32